MTAQSARGPLPATLVFGAFFAVFLPLWLLQAVPNFIEALPYLTVAHAVGLGTTHFFVTLAVYFDRENLAHFGSSAKNRLVYFVAPLLILGFFAWLEGGDARQRFGGQVAYLLAALRFLDFFHVGRQSFGMLQLWKRPVGAELPRWSRPAENAFFIGMAVMQWLTFRFGGRFSSAVPWQLAGAVTLSALFFVLVLCYVRAVERLNPGARRPPLVALGYFAMQALCAAVAVYDTRFYLVALTLHYVEYHAMMAPRCFGGAADAWGARGPLSVLRRHPAFFYLGLLLVVVAFELRGVVGAGAAPSVQYMVHVFDGIFFVHYFLEAFLWKLRSPYYRRRLGPLYLDAPQPETSSVGLGVGAPAPARPSRRPEWALVATSLALVLLAWTQGLVARAAEQLEQRVGRPMSIDSHLRWSVRLAERGDFTGASAHADAVLRLHPESVSAQQLHKSIAAARARQADEELAP